MPESMTLKEINDLLYSRDKDLVKAMEKRDGALKEFITEQFENHNALEAAHRETLDQRLQEGSKKIAELDCILTGNGKDGLVVLVDRLWQGRWWVTVLALAVVGKIVADIFLK